MKRYIVGLLITTLVMTGCIPNTGNRYSQSFGQSYRPSPIQTYAKQVEEAKLRGSPVVITRVSTSRPNSAGGVNAYVDFIAVADSPIKYAIFTTMPYNAVNDRVASRIGGQIEATLKATGPYHYGATNGGKYWENVWYNTTIVCASILRAEIILMDGTTRRYAGDTLGDIFASGHLNGCGGNTVENALNMPAGDPKPSMPAASAGSVAQPSAAVSDIELAALPNNAGGIAIKLPANANNGAVVPVTVDLEEPLTQGDRLIIAGDGVMAIQVTTEAPAVSVVSTRLRLRTGKVTSYVIRADKRIDSQTVFTRIGVPAREPPLSGLADLKPMVRSFGNEVKMLFKSDMPSSGYIKHVYIRTAGGTILVTMAPGVSENPYLGIKSPHHLEPVSIKASS